MNDNFISIQWLVLIVVYLWILKKIIFHEFEKKRFFFIVNGKIYHTNSLVANLISPIISKNYKEKNEQQSIQTSRMRFQLIGKLFQFSSRSVIKIYTSATIFECFLNHLRKTLKYFWLYYLHNSYCTIIYIYIFAKIYIYVFWSKNTHWSLT